VPTFTTPLRSVWNATVNRHSAPSVGKPHRLAAGNLAWVSFEPSENPRERKTENEKKNERNEGDPCKVFELAYGMTAVTLSICQRHECLGGSVRQDNRPPIGHLSTLGVLREQATTVGFGNELFPAVRRCGAD